MNPGPTTGHSAARRLDEATLQRALTVGQVVVWQWDLRSNQVICSEGADAFYGVRIETIDDFSAVFHPDDLVRVDASTRRARETGGGYDVTYRLRAPGAEWRWVQSRAQVETDDDGRPCQVIGTTVDITQQVHAEEVNRMLAHAGEVLGASLDYNSTLTALARVVIPTLADWYALDLLDENGLLQRIATVHPDPACLRLAEELERRYMHAPGSPGPSRVAQTGQAEWAEFISDEQLVASAQDEHHLGLLRALDFHSYVTVPLVARGATLGALTLLFAESGRCYRQADIDVVHDLARRVAVAVDNARLFEQLQLADRRKDEFLAMLAHELRNPLAPISTAARLLRLSGNADGVVAEASAVIARQTAHMTELVDDLLDVSRVTRGLIQIHRVALDLRVVVLAAIEQVGPAIAARHQVLEQTLDDAPLMVDGDHARLVQVVTNLLTNANKYTPPGGRICLRAWRDTRWVTLTVDDTGSGIDASLLPHVFELFTQGKRTPDRTQGGLGIGLALVCSIVRMHGGEIDARSEGPGKGSCFILRLPVMESHGVAASMAAGPATTARDRKRILVVDDNADAASVLARVLRLEGQDVEVALNAQQALQMATAGSPFDVCVLDIGLPDMSGHDLAARLLAAVGQPRPLLIALTGYGQPEDRMRSAQAGFDHHLVKPADVSQLLSLI